MGDSADLRSLSNINRTDGQNVIVIQIGHRKT
jgi:hypothetical protein